MEGVIRNFMTTEQLLDMISLVELKDENLLRDGISYLGFLKEDCITRKVIVLVNSSGEKVGGILNAGSDEIFMAIYPQYRGMHYLSNFFKTGIFNEIWPECKEASIIDNSSSSAEYYAKIHLLELSGLKIRNLDDVLEWIKFWEETEAVERRYSSEII